jgi:hypothetical protein
MTRSGLRVDVQSGGLPAYGQGRPKRCFRYGAEAREVCLDHQSLEGHRGLPAQLIARLRRISHERMEFRSTALESRVDIYEVTPIEVDVSECNPEQFRRGIALLTAKRSYSGEAREARHGHFQTDASRSPHRLPLVLGVGATRIWRRARLRVVRRSPARAGSCGGRADGVAADDPPLGVRPPQRRWRSTALRRVGTTRWARHDLLAARSRKRVRPAPEPVAMAACRDRVGYRRHRRPCPTGLRRLGRIRIRVGWRRRTTGPAFGPSPAHVCVDATTGGLRLALSRTALVLGVRGATAVPLVRSRTPLFAFFSEARAVVFEGSCP